MSYSKIIYTNTLQEILLSLGFEENSHFLEISFPKVNKLYRFASDKKDNCELLTYIYGYESEYESDEEAINDILFNKSEIWLSNESITESSLAFKVIIDSITYTIFYQMKKEIKCDCYRQISSLQSSVDELSSNKNSLIKLKDELTKALIKIQEEKSKYINDLSSLKNKIENLHLFRDK